MKKEINLSELKMKVEKRAKQIIVFDEFTFIEKRDMDEFGGSCYIFGAYNKKIDGKQQVSYYDYNDAIDFNLWTISLEQD